MAPSRRFSATVRLGMIPPVLRNIGDAHAGDGVARVSGDGFVQQGNAALLNPNYAHDAFQGGRFSGAIPAEQRDDLSLVHTQIDPVQDMGLAVIAVDVVDTKHR